MIVQLYVTSIDTVCGNVLASKVSMPCSAMSILPPSLRPPPSVLASHLQLLHRCMVDAGAPSRPPYLGTHRTKLKRAYHGTTEDAID